MTYLIRQTETKVTILVGTSSLHLKILKFIFLVGDVLNVGRSLKAAERVSRRLLLVLVQPFLPFTAFGLLKTVSPIP